MTTFTTPNDIQRFRAITIKAALKLYAQTGMMANRAYTPTSMMRVAKEITGVKCRARDYWVAIAALEAWIDDQRA